MKINNGKTRDSLFGEVIYTYTRRQAVEDGYQILLTGENAELAQDIGWKYPVYFTRGVWDLIEDSAAFEDEPIDLTGILWDILMMARFGKDVTDDLRKFYVTIRINGRPRRCLFYVQVGPTDMDEPSPALTIMQEEDR